MGHDLLYCHCGRRLYDTALLTWQPHATVLRRVRVDASELEHGSQRRDIAAHARRLQLEPGHEAGDGRRRDLPRIQVTDHGQHRRRTHRDPSARLFGQVDATRRVPLRAGVTTRPSPLGAFDRPMLAPPPLALRGVATQPLAGFGARAGVGSAGAVCFRVKSYPSKEIGMGDDDSIEAGSGATPSPSDPAQEPRSAPNPRVPGRVKRRRNRSKGGGCRCGSESSRWSVASRRKLPLHAVLTEVGGWRTLVHPDLRPPVRPHMEKTGDGRGVLGKSGYLPAGDVGTPCCVRFILLGGPAWLTPSPLGAGVVPQFLVES